MGARGEVVMEHLALRAWRAFSPRDHVNGIFQRVRYIGSALQGHERFPLTNDVHFLLRHLHLPGPLKIWRALAARDLRLNRLFQVHKGPKALSLEPF